MSDCYAPSAAVTDHPRLLRHVWPALQWLLDKLLVQPRIWMWGSWYQVSPALILIVSNVILSIASNSIFFRQGQADSKALRRSLKLSHAAFLLLSLLNLAVALPAENAYLFAVRCCTLLLFFVLDVRSFYFSTCGASSFQAAGSATLVHFHAILQCLMLTGYWSLSSEDRSSQAEEFATFVLSFGGGLVWILFGVFIPDCIARSPQKNAPNPSEKSAAQDLDDVERSSISALRFAICIHNLNNLIVLLMQHS